MPVIHRDTWAPSWNLSSGGWMPLVRALAKLFRVVTKLVTLFWPSSTSVCIYSVERRSNTNMCRWGFLSQNILAQWIVVMRDRKCAVSHFPVVFPRHGTLRSLKTYKDILDLHWFSSQFAESSAQFRSKTVLIHNFNSLTQGCVTWQA